MAVWGAVIAASSATAPGADDCVGRPRQDQELEVIGRGIARALLQPRASLVVFRPALRDVGGVGPPPSPLWQDIDAMKRFSQHCMPVEISEVLSGPAEVGISILSAHAVRATHLGLLEVCNVRDYDRILEILDEGSIGPMFLPLPPFSDHIGVVVPLREERISDEAIREEYRRISAARGGELESVLEPVQSWIAFPLENDAAEKQTPDDDRDRIFAGTRLDRDVVGDLRTIVTAVLPPIPAKPEGAAFLRTCPLEKFRVIRGKLKTGVGRLVLDELERLASNRIVPTGAAVTFWNDRTNAFEGSEPEVPGRALAEMWDGDLRTGWSPATVGRSYQIEMRLERRERLTRIDIEWSMAHGKRPLDLFLSRDKGKTWRQVEISVQRSAETSEDVACSDETTVVLLDGAPVDRVRIRFNQANAAMAMGIDPTIEAPPAQVQNGGADAAEEHRAVDADFREIDLRTRPLQRAAPREGR